LVRKEATSGSSVGNATRPALFRLPVWGRWDRRALHPFRAYTVINSFNNNSNNNSNNNNNSDSNNNNNNNITDNVKITEKNNMV